METAHLDIPWSQIVGFLLTAAFGSWAWVVKKFGEQHIVTIRELATEIREMRKELNVITTRVAKIEFAQEHFHPGK